MIIPPNDVCSQSLAQRASGLSQNRVCGRLRVWSETQRAGSLTFLIIQSLKHIRSHSVRVQPSVWLFNTCPHTFPSVLNKRKWLFWLFIVGFIVNLFNYSIVHIFFWIADCLLWCCCLSDSLTARSSNSCWNMLQSPTQSHCWSENITGKHQRGDSDKEKALSFPSDRQKNAWMKDLIPGQRCENHCPENHWTYSWLYTSK